MCSMFSSQHGVITVTFNFFSECQGMIGMGVAEPSTRKGIPIIYDQPFPSFSGDSYWNLALAPPHRRARPFDFASPRRRRAPGKPPGPCRSSAWNRSGASWTKLRRSVPLLMVLLCKVDLSWEWSAYIYIHTRTTNVDATSQNSHGRNNKGTREY